MTATLTCVITEHLRDRNQEPVEVTLTLDGLEPDHRLVNLLGNGITTVDRHGTVRLSLDGYGCRWLRAVRPGATPVL